MKKFFTFKIFERMKVHYLAEMTALIVLLSFGCQQNSAPVHTDFVYSVQLADLRLGDGVPLDLDVYVRWKIEEPKQFLRQFPTTDTFNRMVLYPRAMELGSAVANDFESVDSVFSSQREMFLAAIKNALLNELGEEGMTVKEVTVSNIVFPESYTQAMEKVGLQRQLLEGIKQEKVIAVERAAAEREQTVAESQVDIAKAEAEGRVAQINARTEESRRKSEMAKAETQAQITRKQAQAEADRNRLLAAAELEKREQMDNLDIEKGKKSRRAELESQREMATMVQANPVFASFLINRELASKVEIAVLPTGADPNVFGGLLKQGMGETKN